MSVWGSAGTGVYRTNSEDVGVQADGIRDEILNLFGKVKQGIDRIAIP
jgi:vacuolar protein sorting-associated protein 45